MDGWVAPQNRKWEPNAQIHGSDKFHNFSSVSNFVHDLHQNQIYGMCLLRLGKHRCCPNYLATCPLGRELMPWLEKAISPSALSIDKPPLFVTLYKLQTLTALFSWKSWSAFRSSSGEHQFYPLPSKWGFTF